MKRSLKHILLGLLMLACTTMAHAGPLIGINSSVNGGGLFATGSWADGGSVWSYFYMDLGDGRHRYDYRLSVHAKDISHAIIGVSDSFSVANILAGTTDGWELGTFGSNGNSDPGIPGEMYGLKFPGFDTDELYTIITDRGPIWTSEFYAKDGRDGNGSSAVDVYAHSSKFGETYDGPVTDPQPIGFIIAPDTTSGGGGTGTIPEPGSLSLAVLGIAGVAIGVGRKKKLPPQGLST